MVDYSKFDHIVDSDDDEEDKRILNSEERIRRENEWNMKQQAEPNSAPQQVQENPFIPPPPSVRTQKGKEGNRLKFEYGGKTIYEWEQSLQEIIIYIQPPPGVNKKMFDIVMSP